MRRAAHTKLDIDSLPQERKNSKEDAIYLIGYLNDQETRDKSISRILKDQIML